MPKALSEILCANFLAADTAEHFANFPLANCNRARQFRDGSSAVNSPLNLITPLLFNSLAISSKFRMPSQSSVIPMTKFRYFHGCQMVIFCLLVAVVFPASLLAGDGETDSAKTKGLEPIL